jgi:tetratricopeptide (TPR) repeat protein
MMRIGVLFLIFIAMACSNKEDVAKLNFLKRGNQAYQEQNFDAAIRYYNEALAVDSSFVDALNNRGLAEMAMGLNDEAIFSFNTALQFKPDYAEAQFNYVKANLAVGQFYASLEGLEGLEKIWQDSSIIHFTRGLVYHDMKNDEQAMASFNKASALDPDNVEISINIANVHYHMGQYNEAIALLKEAIVREAGNAQAYNILAMCYVGLNDFESAAGVIATAVSLDREDPYILNNQGYIALKQEDLGEAEKLFIQSMKRDPYNGWVYRNLGLLRLAQDNFEDAERMLGRAYDTDPTIDNLNFDYAEILIRQENYGKLCQLLESDSLLASTYASEKTKCANLAIRPTN